MDLKNQIDKLENDFKTLVHNVESSFIRNEQGEIGYAEHRLEHKRLDEKLRDTLKAREKLISTVTTWAVIGLLTIIGNALVHAYIIPLLPLLNK
jgi:hypothetical protein